MERCFCFLLYSHLVRILLYILWTGRTDAFLCLSYTLPAIFRPPPEAPNSYEPYVSPTTADLIDDYTIPAIKSTLEELTTLGVI